MSALIGFIRQKFTRAGTAQVAKDRLQIIVAHQRLARSQEEAVNLKKLRQKLVEIIASHLHIDQNQMQIALERDADRSVLVLNVTLPDHV